MQKYQRVTLDIYFDPQLCESPADWDWHRLTGEDVVVVDASETKDAPDEN